MKFSPSPSLARALGTCDAGIIRAALVLELADSRLSSAYLQAAMAFTAEQCIQVFVPFEEGRFKLPMSGDKTTWSADYHDDQVASLDANFSIERFLHVVEVRERLRSLGVPGFAVNPEPCPALPSLANGRKARAATAAGGASRRDGGAPPKQPTAAQGNWVGRIAVVLAIGLAALAVYFLGRLP